MEHPHLVIEGVHKHYGDHAVLTDIQLSIREGEFFFLLGPSGCGKTTLLRILAGLLEPDRGRILLDGADITHTRPHLRDLHTVFQHYALFPHLTVADNIAFGLRMGKEPESVIRKKVSEALNLVKLDGLEHRKPTELSGGQSQRVALARALVNEPSVLLLDEPLGALDVKLRQQMQLELKQLQRRLHTTFVCVTHDQEEALSLGDRIAVMDQGVVQQIGTPAELYHRPINRFVCEFLGTANILELQGRLFGLRPEDVRIGDGPGAEMVELEDTLFNGHYRQLHCRRRNGSRLTINAQEKPEDNRFLVHWVESDLMPL